MKIAGHLLFALALSAACATMNAGAGGGGYSVQEKTLRLGSGETLRYTQALPPRLSPGEVRPLIVALHYGGEVTPYYGKPYLASLVLPALRELGAIMVAPDCPGKGWTYPLSEKAVLELIQRVQADHSVDPQRLVVTGYSLGAVGVWDLAFKHPHLFSAAIPVSGTPPKGIFVRPTGTGFWVIHSSDDEVIPIEPVRKFVRSCVSEGLSVRFFTVANLGHYQYDRHVPALKRAVHWLRSLWEGKAQGTRSNSP